MLVHTVIDYAVIEGELLRKHGRKQFAGFHEGSRRDHIVAEDLYRR